MPPSIPLTGPLSSLRLIAAGFLLALFSSFGQTFFIALFGGHIRNEFGLTHGEFGGIYTLANLASGVVMIWVGALLDRVSLRRYALGAMALLAVSAAAASAVPASVFALGLVLFGLRLSGQGMLSHASATSMARFFAANRGKAMAGAALGHPAGEAVFPILVVATIALVGWRTTWLAAALLLAALLPLVALLLADPRARARAAVEAATGPAPARPDGTRRDVLRDLRFHLLLPSVVGPGFVITAIFFHQVHLVETRGWELPLFASAYLGYAGASVVGTLLSGPLIDRVGASSLVRFHLLPMVLGCGLLGVADAPAVAFVFMALCGLSSGVRITVMTALWAELYGIAHLGAIRAMIVAVMVTTTALAPGVTGWLIDLGVSVDTLALWSAAFLALATALAAVATRRP